jgi:hypothetical protein
MSDPMYNVILEAINVQDKEHISSPAIDNMENVIVQSITLLLIELTNNTPIKAKENPATRALIKADCLHISAKFSGVRFTFRQLITS